MSYTIDSARLDGAYDYAFNKLKAWGRIPSISNPNFDQAEVQKSAEFVADTLKELGLEVKIARSKTDTGELGAPAVLAKKIVDPNLPTVLLYSHHDVQPVNSPQSWDTDPFEPTVKNGRLYGRGIADDGGGLIQHFAALKYWGDDLPVNVLTMIEGEEEIGSPSFANFVKDHQAALKADYYIIADDGETVPGTPSITISLRGVITLTIEVRLLEHDVHSGMFSGPILDPYTLVAKLVASLHDEKGDVAVQGLVSYDDNYDYETEAAFREASSLIDSAQLVGTGSIAARLGTKPTITFIGMDIPRYEQASNTIAPVAHAKLSVRTAPGEDQEAAFNAIKNHLERVDIFGAQLTVKAEAMGPGFKSDLDSTLVQKAKETYREVWGKDPVYVCEGGTIPLTSVLQENYPEAQIMMTMAEDPDSRAHSANESIDLDELKKFVTAETLLLAKLSEVR
ncbi:MAG: M20/M25/M40 family metallo-hydrolase [Bifidobacteriaceae bacterium]|jgi:acetylornithine deacetylase/succinyl-diaminopimelate desuccinylase-like protein|nr:M20/M25/M40 family metallo-hydrolase [Bifidobacteriaceae bacterium]